MRTPSELAVLKQGLLDNAGSIFLNAVSRADTNMIETVMRHDTSMKTQGVKLFEDVKVHLGGIVLYNALLTSIQNKNFAISDIILSASQDHMPHIKLKNMTQLTLSALGEHKSIEKDAQKFLNRLSHYMVALNGPNAFNQTIQKISLSHQGHEMAKRFTTHYEWAVRKENMLSLKKLPWADDIEIGAAKITSLSAFYAQKQAKRNARGPKRT